MCYQSYKEKCFCVIMEDKKRVKILIQDIFLDDQLDNILKNDSPRVLKKVREILNKKKNDKRK